MILICFCFYNFFIGKNLCNFVIGVIMILFFFVVKWFNIFICCVFNFGFVILIFDVISLFIGYSYIFFLLSNVIKFLCIFCVWYKLCVMINCDFFVFLYKVVINNEWEDVVIFDISCFFNLFFNLLIIDCIFLFL